MTARMPLTVLADDLTGACDAGTLFAGKAPVPLTVWPTTRAPDADVRVIDLETRGASPAEAARVAREAAAQAAGGRVFVKIDSTLRGPIGAVIDALMDATGAHGAVVCPAFPAQGRVVVERVLFVHGVAVAETPIAQDPHFPRPRRTGFSPSSTVDLVREQVTRPLSWIPLAQVREGRRALAARLTRLVGTVAIADAETDADLDALVDAACALPAPPLLAGAAGLARALAAHLGVLAERTALPVAAHLLIVAGSLHPSTRAQVEAARAAGLRVLATPGSPDTDRQAAAARLAVQARDALDAGDVDLVIVTGGETAVALYRALDAQRIDLIGAPVPGLAMGRLRAPRHAALPIITKAGGFGDPSLFVTLAGRAAA
jgi:D-threonate/D-erythronate kinase